ncbi:MAG: thioether cross-link-forming SCIFF peptide maturase [Clostridiales bacterium]|nr:thioether cross-link-forming SCIFF peptide maturase [Clostridiales bacterium]
MIHKFSMNSMFIVMDINSGAIHTVDEMTYKLLEHAHSRADLDNTRMFLETYGGEYPEADILSAIEELKEAAGGGALFAPDIYEGYTGGKNGGIVKALCLHIAHDCNLRCKYCFAGKGAYNGERGLMSADVGRAAIDFLIERSKGRRQLEVDFFGGEPTVNFDTVKEIVSYARRREVEYEKNIRFTLTTNGVALDDSLMDYVNRHMRNVVLSADGRKSVNDRMRTTLGGGGSYDAIMPKFQKLADSRGQENYYIRGTYTRENLDFAEDVKHLADMGFRQISMEPVVAEKGADYALREEDLTELFRQYEILAEEMLKREQEGRGFNFFHFTVDLDGGPCVIKRLTGCGAGMEYLAVTPEGDLYPCHQFVGQRHFIMGNVFDGISDNGARIRKAFSACSVYAKPGCKSCWARYYCGGGCAAAAYFQSGDILSPYSLACELMRKRIECAVYINAVKVLTT